MTNFGMFSYKSRSHCAERINQKFYVNNNVLDGVGCH